MSSQYSTFKRDRYFNRGTTPRRKSCKGGWSVPPAYTGNAQNFRDCSTTNNKEKSNLHLDGNAIPEHNPDSTVRSPLSSSVSDPKNGRFIYNFFSQLQIFPKRKIQIDFKQVVKQILEEEQMLKRQRIEMMDGWTGDVGLALFTPIDWEEIEDVPSSGSLTESEGSESEDSLDGVTVTLEHDPDVESSPPILSNSQFYEIQSNLPPAVTHMTWTRAYSLNRDGDHFRSLMEKVENYQHTITVIRTKDGDILGGYADTAWGTQRSASSKKKIGSFFGGGRAFLFATKPDLDKEEEMKQEASDNTNTYNANKDTISFYPWTGVNEYSQICDVTKGNLGMGGGGSFGWFIQDNFTNGSSGPCMTFRNPPLTEGEDGHFKIVDLEIYGFKSMAERVTAYSQISLSQRSGCVTRSPSSSPSRISFSKRGRSATFPSTYSLTSINSMFE